MPPRFRQALSSPGLLPVAVVGLTLACVLAGYEPIGADPDLLYRPIKSELARTLADGRLPLWSDVFGLGVPLAAESHAAAFHPPNWLLYRLFRVASAFRLAMWLSMVATAVSTYLYARGLGLGAWGAAMASISFSLCGFQTSHSGHEPFYVAMPYLPLCLLAADRYASTGRTAWMAALALAWGVQLTVGHFQIPFWTGGLALWSGLGRIMHVGAPRRRSAGLVLSLVGGLAVAAVQLVLTRELVQVAGFARSYDQLAAYSFPPGHWMQPGFPALFARPTGPGVNHYWGSLATSPAEATFHIGTIPLLLAFVGLFAERENGALTPWRWIVPASLVLATMPRWFPFGYWLVTFAPGLGWFRCPGRYTLAASLGLALLAGRGTDLSISSRRFGVGLTLAISFGLASLSGGFLLAGRPLFRSCLGESTIALRFGAALAAWVLGVGVVIAHRRGRIGGWAPWALAGLELAALYHVGPVRWGRSIASPEESPILRRLAAEPGVGLVAGPLEDLPVRAGMTPAYPYLGMSPPPPNYLLEAAKTPSGSTERGSARWLRRFGVTHGVWREGDLIPGAETLFVAEDRTLDWIVLGIDSPEKVSSWKIVRYPGTWPAAWASRRATIVPDWGALFQGFPASETTDVAFYLPEDAPPEPLSPRANLARVTHWDGRTAIVEHDGACDLIVRRTYYPGWTAKVEGVGERPIFKGDAGLQAVRLDGRGPTRVTFGYRPTGLVPASVVSVAATVCCLLVLAGSALRGRKNLYPAGDSLHSNG